MKYKSAQNLEFLRDPWPVRRPRHLRIADESGEKRSFYRITNPGKLASVGASYLEDFKKGVKSFAISSASYKSSQQKTVLALASYFDHLFDLKILIVSDSLQRGVFKDLVTAGTYVAHPVPLVRFYHHFDFLDLNQALAADFGTMMGQLMDEYDVVFWDTPMLSSNKRSTETFTKIASYFGSLSLIVSPSLSRTTDTGELKKHFEVYGINLSGIMFKEIRDRID